MQRRFAFPLLALLVLSGCGAGSAGSEDDGAPGSGTDPGAQRGPGSETASTSQLKFIADPSDTVVSKTLAPVKVAIVDKANQVRTDATDMVTLTLAGAPSPGYGGLEGTLQAPAVNGVATFSDLTILTAGAGYVLDAAAPAFAKATSKPFSMLSGAKLWRGATETAGAPAPRRFHVAVWTGSEMIVWGGQESVGGSYAYVNTGGRYNPKTNTWMPVSTVGAPPAPGVAGTAVWTGKEMIVWGGQRATNAITGTGGRYDPATDTWKPTSMVGAPAARSGHTAIWTGKEMIIWGGVTGYSSGATLYTNSGSRYDPATDTWSPLSTSGQPAPRELATAVWTGSKMIIWGGSTVACSGGTCDITYFQNATIYDPATNGWSPANTAGAPTSRRGRSIAVWTGSQMIALGTSGASYDPSTNAWANVALTGAPETVATGQGLWSGSQLVVWGPPANANVVAGGHYDPSTNAWTSIPSLGSPTPRAWSTEVWTGTEFISWGGSLPTTPYTLANTGGRYLP